MGLPQLHPEQEKASGEGHKMSMNVLVVEPMKAPYAKEIDGSLESMQQLVGGYIEAVYPFKDPIALVCNDEGKLMGLPPNRLLRDDSGQPYDIVCGTFFVVGLSRDNFKSLPDKYMAKYAKLFAHEWLASVPGRAQERKNLPGGIRLRDE